MIEVGSLVVCINDTFPYQIWEYTSEVPRKGHLYTVKRISRAPNGLTGNLAVGLKLNEVDSGPVIFAAWRFREFELEVEETEELAESQPVELVGLDAE